MKKIIIYIFILNFLSPKVLAQCTNANWCFGDSVGIDWSISSLFLSGCDGRGGVCASVSDINHNLLLYATAMRYQLANSGLLNRGCIYNGNHNRILGGDTIVGDGWYHDVLIIPKSELDSTYYVFSTHVTYPYGLYYSIVDLKLNNGQGQVIQKNVLIDTAAIFDGLTAVKHGNGRDWWLVYRTWDPGTNNFYYNFYVDLITNIGIQSPYSQNSLFGTNSSSGQILFNSKADKCVLVTWGGGGFNVFF